MSDARHATAIIANQEISHLAKIKVLIVEDDLSIADLLQSSLEKDGFFVVGVAQEVEEALELADEYKPDFAVIDLYLARGGLGTQVGLYLRKMNNVGILFSTGNDDVDKLTCLVGDAVMVKPYRLSDVPRALRIINDVIRIGQSHIELPRSFRLLV